MEAVLDNLKQETRCLMCREAPEELKALKCFHLYCVNCLATHVELNEDGAAFDCPSCKATTRLPRCNDFASLESSSLHSHILKILSLVTPDQACSEVPRCSCRRRNQSTSYCNNCARYLCEECIGGHELLTQGHTILNLRQLQDHEYGLLFRQQSFCGKPQHSNEILKFYCNTCKSCICQQCLLQDHQGLHDICALETKAQTQNAALQENLRELELKETEEERNLQVLEEVLARRKQNIEDTKTHVIKAIEDLIVFIEENKRDMIRRIDVELNKVDTWKEEQECLLRQIHTAKGHLYKLTEYATSSQIVFSNDSIQERLEELRALQVNLDEPDYHMEFIPSEEVHKLQELGIGSLINVRPVDALKSTLNVETGLGELKALNKVMLSTLIKDSSGELNSRRDANVEVSIDPNENVKHLRISQNTGGKCDIEFIPKVPGHFTVSGKVNGHDVSNSPMALDIKPQELKVTGEFMMTGMGNPHGIAVNKPNTKIAVTDHVSHCIAVCNMMSGMGESLNQPCGIALNKPNTKIAITDRESNCIAVFNTEGELLNKIQITGEGCKQLNHPHGVAFLNNNDIVVADCYNHRIVIFDTTARRVLKCFGRQGQGIGEFQYSCGVHVDEQGRIIVCDDTHVQVFTGDGLYQFHVDKQLLRKKFSPRHAVSHGNLLFVSDLKNDIIHVVELQDGHSVSRRCRIGRPGTNDGELMSPRGLAIDSDGNLLVCDNGNQRIQKFTMDGRFVGKTHQTIKRPVYLTVLADGRVLVTKQGTNRITVVQ